MLRRPTRPLSSTFVSLLVGAAFAGAAVGQSAPGAPASFAPSVSSAASAALEASVPSAAFGPSAPLDGLWVDYDGDGLDDIAWIEEASGLRLLRNDGVGGFADGTAAAGLDRLGPLADAVWADYDADGLADLAVIPAGGSLRLFHNARGRFDDETRFLGAAATGHDAHARWLDYDGDGLVDLAVVGAEGARLNHNLGRGAFERVELPVGADVLVAVLVGAAREIRAPGAQADARTGPRLGGRGMDDVRRWLASSVATSTPVGLPFASGPDELSFAACGSSLVDAAGGPCIAASSLPQLGKLLPLSSAFFVDAAGKVGLGTTSPAEDLHVVGDDPRVRVGRSADPGSYIELQDLTSNTMKLNKLTASGAAQMDFSPVPLDGTGTSTVRLFRNADTTGAKRFQLHKGDGTSGVDVQLAVAGENSYFNGGGNVGIGTSTPLADLHVEGGTTLDVRDGGVNGNVLVVSSPSVAERGGLIFTQYVDYPAGKEGWKFFTVGSGTIGSSRLSLGTIETSKPDSVSEVLTLRGSKRVGINTTSPQDTLDVNGTTRTHVLTITGGSDLVEAFDASQACEPGTVVSVDPERAPAVRPSMQARDRRIVGIVSGAGGVCAGLTLEQAGVLDGDVHVAIAGRVYVKACSENGPIEPGDLLVSASLPGHAMRTSDAEATHGTIIGKALGTIDADTGLVLVLVNLQ